VGLKKSFELWWRRQERGALSSIRDPSGYDLSRAASSERPVDLETPIWSWYAMKKTGKISRENIMGVVDLEKFQQRRVTGSQHDHGSRDLEGREGGAFERERASALAQSS